MIIRSLGTLISLIFLIFLTSCYRVSDELEPKVNYVLRENFFKKLSPPFAPLTDQEKLEPWGKEYLLGQFFARDLDFYRAITTFKRAEYLLGEEKNGRYLEIQYQILLCYFLGKRYEEVLYVFNCSKLYLTTPAFPVHRDLLMILYESYLQTDQREKAEMILRTLSLYYEETAKKLELSTMMIEGDLEALEQNQNFYSQEVDVTRVINEYQREKKSVNRAQLLNMVIPGAGFLYVGQKQSAITAFLLNGLFIAAAIHFFHQNQIAAGLITTSFEMGWYFGGIYGAGEAAKLYNARIYEKLVSPILNCHALFPVLMLKYGF